VGWINTGRGVSAGNKFGAEQYGAGVGDIWWGRMDVCGQGRGELISSGKGSKSY